jgi:hypothetical protein
MRSLRVLVPAAAIVLGSACDFVTSLDGLSGGASPDAGGSIAPDGAPDGATQAGDARNDPDARSLGDGPAGDSSPPVDSATDSSAAGDASNDAPTTFCATRQPQPLFCADFDEGVLAQGWSYVHTVGGSLALDTSDFTSPPAAMIAQSGIITMPNATVDVAAYRSFTLGGQTFTGTVEADLRVDKTDAAGGVAVLAQIGLADGGGGGDYFLQLVTGSNGGAPLSCSVNEIYFSAGMSSTPVRHPVAQTIALRTWTHIALSVTAPFAGGAGTATLSINGAQVGTAGITVPVRNFAPTIGVGLLYVLTPSNGWSAIFDDVTFNGTGT